jgi:triosephosphate isomerase
MPPHITDLSQFIASKTKAALDGGLSVILCIGESLEQREANQTIDVVTSQLQAVASLVSDWSKVVIAYEPIWAIGTGKVATTQQAQEVHAAIRDWFRKLSPDSKTAEEVRIIYGGSVNEKNCGELAKEKDIDGFLVGGASLKPACKFSLPRLCGDILITLFPSRGHCQCQSIAGMWTQPKRWRDTVSLTIMYGLARTRPS